MRRLMLLLAIVALCWNVAGCGVLACTRDGLCGVGRHVLCCPACETCETGTCAPAYAPYPTPEDVPGG